MIDKGLLQAESWPSLAWPSTVRIELPSKLTAGAVQTRKRKQLLIAPGQRADILVKADAPGTYAFNAAPYDQGHPSPVGPLARVVVSGAPMEMKLQAPPPASIKDSEITGRRKVVLSATAPDADVEEWTIVNTHEHDDHVFHIQTNPFEVVSVNGKALATPEWRDSVIVERKGGELVFRSRFLDFTGIFMLHCHMMNHEEMGMMQTVEVYRG